MPRRSSRLVCPRSSASANLAGIPQRIRQSPRFTVISTRTRSTVAISDQSELSRNLAPSINCVTGPTLGANSSRASHLDLLARRHGHAKYLPDLVNRTPLSLRRLVRIASHSAPILTPTDISNHRQVHLLIESVLLPRRGSAWTMRRGSEHPAVRRLRHPGGGRPRRPPRRDSRSRQSGRTAASLPAAGSASRSCRSAVLLSWTVGSSPGIPRVVYRVEAASVRGLHPMLPWSFRAAVPQSSALPACAASLRYRCFTFRSKRSASGQTPIALSRRIVSFGCSGSWQSSKSSTVEIPRCQQ